MPWPQASWEWVTRDRVVYQGPCEFYGALLVADSGGTADTTIYDGMNSRGRHSPTLKTAASTCRPFNPKAPLLFGTGIYVDIGSNVEGVLVYYKPAHLQTG